MKLDEKSLERMDGESDKIFLFLKINFSRKRSFFALQMNTM